MAGESKGAMSGSQIHVKDSSRIKRFAATLSDVAQAHPFRDDEIVACYATALDAFEGAMVKRESEIAELRRQWEQEEDDEARADLQQQIGRLEQERAQIQCDQQQVAQAKRSYEERATELDRVFAVDAERVATALTRFVQGLESATGA